MNPEVKPWWQSKMMWTNIIGALVILMGFLSGPEVLALVPDGIEEMWIKIASAITVGLNLILRPLSNARLASSEASAQSIRRMNAVR